MGLRTKFSLLLAICVLLSVFFTTLALSVFFAADQKAYVDDLQSTLAIFGERQLETRAQLLYTQLAPLVGSMREHPKELRTLIARTPGAVSVEIFWKGSSSKPPLWGGSPWALLPPPPGLTEAVRWVGRYGPLAVVVDLKREYFAGVLESSHGASSRLVFQDGKILIGSAKEPGAKPGELRAEALEKSLAGPVGIPRTIQYKYAGSSQLGTSLLLDVDPRALIFVTTPWNAVQAVVARTYRQALWIAVVFLALAIVLGIAFSGTLTAPLQDLVRQSSEVAKGRFDENLVPEVKRRDEVGRLARSFRRMVHELRKLRQELGRAERLAAFGQFSACIAHEIKNPLGSILGNTQLLRRKLEAGANTDDEVVGRSLQYIEQETLRANEIVLRLMKFARQDRLPDTEIDLTDVLRRSLDLLQAQIHQREICLDLNIPDVRVPCVANADEIHEVLSNLAENAIYAMRDSAERRLTVSLVIHGSEAVISIRDTGQGMSSEALDHCFEPFFTTKPIGEGTGLGLAVCHGIILNHGGRIEVSSTPGQGTEFRLFLSTTARIMSV